MSEPEQSCSTKHASFVAHLLSHPPQPMHFEQAVSDDVEVIQHVLSVAKFFSSYPSQHVQSDGVVFDNDKVDDPPKNAVFRLFVLLAPAPNSNDYLSLEERKDEAFMVYYMSEFIPLFYIFEHNNNDFLVTNSLAEHLFTI